MFRRWKTRRRKPWGSDRVLRHEMLEPRRVLAHAPAIDPLWFAVVAKDEGTRADVLATAVEQEWLVQLTTEAASRLTETGNLEQTLAAALPGLRVLRGLGGPGQLLVSATAEAATLLAKRPEVMVVEANGQIAAASSPPNDPLYQNGSLWALRNLGQVGGLIGADIDAPGAWEITTGSADVVVAIVDGGIDVSHPDLAPNAWRNPGEIPGNGIDDDGNGFIDDVYGWDFRNRDATVFDQGDNQHGTQVAGIIAARGDNGLGVVGVSWNSRVMPLKFIDGSGGSTADAVAAINYVTMMRGRGVNIRVANLSWGSSDSSWLLEQAINAAGAAGILVVASAGNDGLDQDRAWWPNYPSGFPAANMLAVAATDNQDRLVWNSNYGLTRVDLAAPGVNILSTVPGRTYAANSGTSFAAPLVSGVAALAVSANPNLSVGELRDKILGGVEPLLSLAGKTVSGGRLDAARTLALVAADMIEAPTAVKVTGVFVHGSGWSEAYRTRVGFTTVDQVPLGWQLPDGSAQLTNASSVSWNNVDVISVRFDQPIARPAADALQLVLGTSEGNQTILPTAAPTLLAGDTVAQWTLPAALTSGRYVISIASAGITNAAGTSTLDGEWTTSTSTFAAGSGDGTAGGIFNFFFNVLVGDVNGNGTMNPTDISTMRSSLTSPFTTPLRLDSSDYRLDINGSNGLNSADLSQARAQLTSAFGTSLASLPQVTAPTESMARSTKSFAALADEGGTGVSRLATGLSADTWAWYEIEDALRNEAKKR
jgi:subtilisin family serine protease